MKKTSGTILLIDPDSSRKAFVEKFSVAGGLRQYKLECACRLDTGLERLRKINVSAVLLNLGLPDAAGLSAFRKVQKQAPHVPVIVLSSDYNGADAKNVLLKGAQDYLLWSELTRDQLAIAIHNAILRKRAEEMLRTSEMRYRRRGPLEQSVVRKAAELQHIEKLAEMGRMVSILAHEIRNPLQSITLGVENIRNIAKGDKKTHDLLEEVSYGARLLNSLVNDLLEYSLPIRLNYRSEPIGGILEQPLSIVTPDLGIVVQRSIDQAEKRIPVDPGRIRLAFQHLIRNAIESMPDGGTLSIHCRFRKRSEVEVAEITVTDTGAGMTEDQLRQIDEPFFSTKVFGTGMGFPLAKKIIETHGGTVRVKSIPRKGTTVKIVLPASRAD